MSNTCLVITSIAGPENEVLKDYARLCAENNTGFIVAGDTKSPPNFHLAGCEFLSSAAQRALPFKLPALLPDRNYARKNVAYLQAIKKGYSVLVETDDDNFALPDFWQPRLANVSGDLVAETGWANVYAYFSDVAIWPRGFLLQQIEAAAPGFNPAKENSFFCPIQQGLADGNPDVDAIYRLNSDASVYFKKRQPVILGQNSICPFNSQNTTWFKEAFPLLYLPSYCSFRMTDIWRSFVAQRILWTCGWNLSFHNATVRQERNEHDLMKDLEEELSGYLYNGAIVSALCSLELESGASNMPENLLRCYRLLVDKNYVEAQELRLVEAWLSDLETATATAKQAT